MKIELIRTKINREVSCHRGNDLWLLMAKIKQRHKAIILIQETLILEEFNTLLKSK